MGDSRWSGREGPDNRRGYERIRKVVGACPLMLSSKRSHSGFMAVTLTPDPTLDHG